MKKELSLFNRNSVDSSPAIYRWVRKEVIHESGIHVSLAPSATTDYSGTSFTLAGLRVSDVGSQNRPNKAV